MPDPLDEQPVGDLRPVFALLARLETEPPPYGEWHSEERDGVHTFPEYHSEMVGLVLHALYDAGLVRSFAWPEWRGEAERLMREPARLAAADFPQIWRLLTAHARSDRFVEGHFGAMLENGHIRDVLRRLKELAERGEVPGARASGEA